MTSANNENTPDQTTPQTTLSIDSGLGAVIMLLRYHHIGADPGRIQHRFGGVRFGAAEMLLRQGVRPAGAGVSDQLGTARQYAVSRRRRAQGQHFVRWLDRSTALPYGSDG